MHKIAMTMATDKQNKNLNVPNLRFPEFTGEWRKEKLKNKCSFFSGETPSSTNKAYYNGNIPFIRSGEIAKSSTELFLTELGLNNSSAKMVDEGDLLLALYGATSGQIAISKIKGAINQAILCIRAPYDKKFLMSVWEKRMDKILQAYLQGGQGNLSAEIVKNLQFAFPSLNEQIKIGNFLSLIDERIATQSRIIEDLEKLRSAIIEKSYNQKQPNQKIGDVITQIAFRNRNGNNVPVLSVNNRRGFIEQSEQFEDRIVASEDTSNYKIVCKNNFAYNPARINVGSIARLISFEEGIVSPMYICFKTKTEILPEYLEHFFATRHFYYEIKKRLEGSVRLCLSWEGLCNIPIFIPSIKEQKHIGKQMIVISDKIVSEKHYIELLKMQKLYLLSQLFI